MNNSMENTITLQNVDVPRLGFGTWKLDGNACVAAVKDAIEIGYRHIDTAQAYGNEAAVGDAWKSTNVSRNNLFITTKIFREQFADQTTAMASIENSLRKLGTDYVDLLLVHWPFPEYAIEHLIAPLIAAQEQGKARLIGVSNFTIDQMEEARKISGGRICLNQVEYHPMLNQQPLLDYAQKYDWGLTAYSPLGRGEVLDMIQFLKSPRTTAKAPPKLFCDGWSSNKMCWPFPNRPTPSAFVKILIYSISP